MNTARLSFFTVLAALVVIGNEWLADSTPDRAASTRCSRRTISLRSAAQPRVLLVALADSAVSPSRLNPAAAVSERDWDTPPSQTDAWGRVAVVERQANMNDRIRAGDTVLLVPWAYRSDCSRVMWKQGVDWIPAGERGVLWVAPRPRDRWVSGQATFDVWGWHSPYPWSRFLRHDRLYPRQDEPQLLTVDELWELFGVLPTEAELVADTSLAVQRVRAWEAGRPDLAGRYPAVRLLFDLQYRLWPQ